MRHAEHAAAGGDGLVDDGELHRPHLVGDTPKVTVTPVCSGQVAEPVPVVQALLRAEQEWPPSPG